MEKADENSDGKRSLQEAVEELLSKEDDVMMLVITMVAKGEMQDLLEYLMSVNCHEFLTVFQDKLSSVPAEARSEDMNELLREIDELIIVTKESALEQERQTELVNHIVNAMRESGIASIRAVDAAKQVTASTTPYVARPEPEKQPQLPPLP